MEWERERKTSFHALQKPSSLKVTKDPLVNADIGSRPLDKLPVELLEMVFDNLVDEDVIRLSLTSVDLWLMAYRCLQMRYFDRCAPWAGDRLICVGDYARADDLPKAILTKEEIDLIEDQVRQHQAEDLKNEEKKEDLLDEDEWETGRDKDNLRIQVGRFAADHININVASCGHISVEHKYQPGQ